MAAQMPPANVETYSTTLSPAQLENAYTLGAGDLIRVDSFDTPELILEQRYTVLLDGTVNLPWIGSTSVQGLTLAQASSALASKYRRFIRNPVITVGLVAARPLKIGIIGEVNRPGSYVISSVTGTETVQGNPVQRSGAGNTENGSQWPTVSKALQTAGGITQLANIRQIQVKRREALGEEKVLNVDLWKFLQEGDLTQDALLRDGDTIVIPVATALNGAEATQIAGSNFSPEIIKVNVVGEVVTPGAVTIRPNTTLNQAILAAGGLKNGRAKRDVELIRLNPNGTVSRRSLRMDLSKGVDEQSNPPLHNNDVVVVNRNTLAGITDTLGGVIGPAAGLLGLFSIFGR